MLNERVERMSDTAAARPWLALYPPWVPAGITPAFRNATEMFLASARRNGAAPALHYFDRTLTFGELDELSTALAYALQRRGLKRGDRVAAYLQNVPQFPITMLATWKGGGIFVPLSPMLKERELRYHLVDAGARFIVSLESLYPAVDRVRSDTSLDHVITTSELEFLDPGDIPSLLRASARTPCREAIDFMAMIREGAGGRVEDPQLEPDDVAFLTYTSGTTGPAKGAMNTHGNVVFNSAVFRAWLRLGDQDIIAGLAPLFHITGLVAHLTLGMLSGIPVILFYRFDPAEALRLIERWKATFAVAAITAFIALMESRDIGRRNLASLTKVYSGGAPVSPATVERFRKATGTYIHNIYGLTETTSPSHGVPLGTEAPVDPDTGALSVGVPICNTLVRVVDPSSRQDLPPGRIGEIVTKGPMVVPGYWRKPEESSHAIREGWLHTGDVGKMDERGWFYLVDRTKDMIIASGYKVWPREVEDVLYQHPAVREACVIGVPDPYRGETVKAFVSLRSQVQGNASPEDLIQFCKVRLAAYKYPRSVEIVDDLPKTQTGKILRREMREREKNRVQPPG